MYPHRLRGGQRKISTVCAFLATAALAMTLLGGHVFAQESTSAVSTSLPEKTRARDGNLPVEEKLDRKGTIVLGEKATLAEWVLAIQQEWDINIVCSGDVQAQVVSGGFVDAPLRNVLNAILYSTGCGYEVVGNSLLIQRLEDLGALKPQFQLEMIPLQHLSPTEAEPTVRIMLSKGGTVQVIPTSKTLVVADLPDRLARIREHIQVLEKRAQELAEQEKAKEAVPPPARNPALRPGGASPPSPFATSDTPPEAKAMATEVYAAQFISADQLVTPLQSALGTDARVSALTAENRLIVVAPPKTLELAGQILRRIDVPEPQVRISAIMYDVTLESLERLGVVWNHALKGRINASGDPQSMLELNSQMFKQEIPTSGGDAVSDGDSTGDVASTVTSAAVNGMWTVTNLSRHFDLTAYIQALDQTDGARLLARPNILAYNRMEAEIKIITEIPVQELTQTQQGGNIGTTMFREAGIILKVTPDIMEDRTVLLEVAPEFSLLSGYSPDGQPIIDRRTTKTRIRVIDGQMVVIGGLLRRTEMETVAGIPGLMNWKFVGRLFRNHETKLSDTELIIFLRTEIVVPQSVVPIEPREEQARCVAEERLEQIPGATNAPFIPPCGDRHCPYHNPRIYGVPAAGACPHYDHGETAAPVEPYPPREEVPVAPQPQSPVIVAPESASANQEGALLNPAKRDTAAVMRRLPATTIPDTGEHPFSRPTVPQVLADSRSVNSVPVPPSRTVEPPPLPTSFRLPQSTTTQEQQAAMPQGTMLDRIFRR